MNDDKRMDGWVDGRTKTAWREPFFFFAAYLRMGFIAWREHGW